MITPTANQIEAGVLAAREEVAKFTSLNITHFISQDSFENIIKAIITGALNAPVVTSDQQPLAP